MSTFTPLDPLWTSQWYLKNTGQRGGDSRLDLNVLPAWAMGLNGQGIRVAINDDGMDLTHPDLLANIDAAKVYDTNRSLTGSGFVTSNPKAHEHGTVVGSIVGMTANSTGGIGIAYKSTLIPGISVGILDSAPSDAIARLFASNIDANAHVSVNSWGDDTAFNENFGASGDTAGQAWGAQLLRAATVGRDGLGMVIEVSAGNERANRADAALSNFTNNKVTITVAAVDEKGKVTDYSTPAASILVAAFGGVSSAAASVDTGFGIASADVQGAAGYNKTEGAPGDYAYQNVGTSYSGPMVGAAAALMLQANPGLGFRDVSAILAMTARQTDPASPSWVTNGATHWNLGGMHFSRDVGFGLIDIHAAVLLAQSWAAPPATMANWAKAESGPATTVVRPIPDDANTSLMVNSTVSDSVLIDRVEFDLNLTATAPSQLKAVVTSPSGTSVTLFDRPLTRALKDGEVVTEGPENAWPGTFTIGSTAFLGENSAGTWTLQLTDLITGTQATFNSLTVRAWGSAPSENSQYVLTNEFRGDRSLQDSSGTDTLNAAAVTSAVRLDLSGQGASTIASGGTIRLAPATVIENAFGGPANDVLIGNSVSNVLRGHAGDDQLMGGAGNDQLDGGAGTDIALFGGAARGYRLQFNQGSLQLNDAGGSEGLDTLIGIERLQFSDRAVIVESKTHGGFSDLPASVYQFFILAFGAAPGVEYLQQCADAYRVGADVARITNVFCGKSQFTDVYPTTLSNREMATALVGNVVGTSAAQSARDEAVNDITVALDNGLGRGDMIFTVFSNLAALRGDAKWGGTAQLFFNQIAVAKYYTETMNQATTDRATLAAAISAVTPSSDVSSDAAIVALIGQGLLGTGG